MRALPDSGAADSCGYVQSANGRRYEHEPALRKLLWVLPLGPLLVAAAQLLRPITSPIARWSGRNRESIARELALQPARPSSGQADPPRRAAFSERLRRARYWAGQALVLALIAAATSQMLNENRLVPEALKHRQPAIVRATIGYTRLNQGWSMFAPEAPMRDRMIVIDAVTIDGRHIDPWNDMASRISDPSLRSIPERLDQDAVYCDYGSQIPDHDLLHEPLRDWIMAYHRRTHHPADRIAHFTAYVIDQDSPRPDQAYPSNVEARVFLHDE